MNYYVIIPARFASSRLPGKPLVDIGGKSMIQRTYEQCLKAAPAEKIYVATDDERIAAHCRDRGINVVMTSPDCLTGTDRVAEAAKVLEADYYINVQGDEPVIPPDDIRAVIRAAEKGTDEIIAGYTEILDEKDYFSPAIPKMVLSEAGYLMYMSRAPIPGNKKMGFPERHWNSSLRGQRRRKSSKSRIWSSCASWKWE
jgi:3-deoxy-manno-octulosonate cytidylyltransferase (CMP-KDO synthetase)